MRKSLKFLIVSLFVAAAAAFLANVANSATGFDVFYEANAVTIKVSDNKSGVVLLGQDKKGLKLRVDIGSIQFVPVSTRKGSFILPRIDGFSRSFKVGEPMLPVAAKLLAIPFSCKLKAKVLDSTYEDIYLADYNLTDPIMPVQPPLSKSQDPRDVEFEYNEALYETGGKYALKPVQAEVLGVSRAVRLARVAAAPIEYYPKENRIRVYTSATVEIKFVNPNWKLTKKMWKRYSSIFFAPVNRQIINFESTYDWKDDLVTYPIKYAIVADPMFESQLQPFIQWKTKKGFTVVEGYTDEIGSSQSAIKSWLENLYNAGTTEDPAPSFVLFVGDDQQIEAYSGSAGSHITDLRYCEFTGDDYPEMYYGRFSAQNTTELQPQIDKTLEYEQYTMPDPSYLGEVTLVSGVDSTYAETHGNGQINYGTNLYFNAAHGISPHVWLYPDSDASGAAAAIIQTVDDGVGFYNYTAHCSHNGPADPSFSQSDINNLTNIHKYLLGIGNCCLSNTFGDNYSTPCFGEAWLQAEDKGGIGWIGGSNSTYWDEDYWWGVGNGPIIGSGPDYSQTGLGAYDGLFHDHGEPVTRHYITNGAIMYAGNIAVTEAGSSLTEYYWEIYHLMGDPSVMTYLWVPTANSVSHPSSVTTTATSMTVSADAGSYVGITKDGVLHGAGYIGDTGTADIELVPFGATGTAAIVVTCQNRVPYESSIPVVTDSTPPTADFVGSPTSGPVPLTVDFTDLSVNADTWSWDFGDTGTSSEKNPTHQYTSIGTYTVTLTASNAYGSDVETKTDYITVTALQPPVADFTADNTTVYTGDTVNFTDLSTMNPDTWSWDFGDGGTSTEQNPGYQYNSAGVYTVSLTVTNAVGNDTETKVDYITVEDPPLNYCASQGNTQVDEYIGRVQIADLDNSSGPSPYSDFTSMTANMTAGSSVDVTLTPTYTGTIYTEYWKVWIDYNHDGDFEDADEEVFSGYGTTPISGSFTVKSGIEVVTRMRVSMKYGSYPTPCETFTYGEVEDYTANITPGVVVPPVADFSASATIISEGDSVTFTDLSTGNPDTWDWTFAGGTPATSTLQNPIVTYNTAGVYTVTLTVTNAAGSDTETKVDYITVNPSCVGAVNNPGFETGTTSGWTTIGDVSISSGAHSGSYAVSVNGENSAVEQVISGLCANTTYTVSCWGKARDKALVYLGVKNYGGAEQTVQFTDFKNYVQESITFTTGSTNTSVTIFFSKTDKRFTGEADDFEIILQ